jgi:uncharacterized protein YciI
VAVFAVVTQKGSKWKHDRGLRDQPAWDDHAKFFDRLVEQGIVILGGPIGSPSDDEVALLAVEATDEQELRSIFGEDPWAANGVLTIKSVWAWTIWLDRR